MLHWQGSTVDAKIVPFPPGRGAAGRGSLGSLIEAIGTCGYYARNSEIFGEDEPAEYLYKVVSGAVRISKLLSDGRRQIGAFHLPGEMFGLEAEEAHALSAEAISDSRVMLVKRSVFLARVTRDCAMATEMWAQTMVHLHRAQNHMLLLGRKNAQERIAAFLLEMSARLSRAGEIELPMSRQDIADYLGLTIETVSRTLTQLERDGLIGIPASRRIVFRDRAALDLMNDCIAA
jgi:CRP/FNR family nitrogen fixation transcriptional regulator